MSVGCYVGTCSHVVRGQCPGYEKAGCGKYYCAEHSGAGFCGDCYIEKQTDELIGQYSQLASSIKATDFFVNGRRGEFKEPQPGRFIPFFTIFLSLFLFFLIGPLLASLDLKKQFSMTNDGFVIFVGCVTVGVALALSTLLYKYVKRGYIKQKTEPVTQKSRYQVLCEQNVGFDSFYAEWKKERNRQRLGVAVRIAVGALGAAAQLSEERKEREITNAAYDHAKRHNRTK